MGTAEHFPPPAAPLIKEPADSVDFFIDAIKMRQELKTENKNQSLLSVFKMQPASQQAS